jgi:hypothetical protein
MFSLFQIQVTMNERHHSVLCGLFFYLNYDVLLYCIFLFLLELHDCENKWREAALEQALNNHNLFGKPTGTMLEDIITYS